MVEVVHAAWIERAQARQHGAGVGAGRHAQHQRAQLAGAVIARDRQAFGPRRRQRRRARRPGQDLAPHHRRAARIGFQHVAVLAQQPADLVQPHCAQVGQVAQLAHAHRLRRQPQRVEAADLRQAHRRQAQLGVRAAGRGREGKNEHGAPAMRAG